uniref:Ig-like domain-containing protein n=1 Tax=Labrus bergylta TaxID=56723 RepID=A0A3Q3FAB2_9LABR
KKNSVISIPVNVILCIFTALEVIGGRSTTVQGGATLTQISWQRLTRGKPRTDNFYTISSHYGPRSVNGRDDRFRFIGSFTDKEGTLQLSNVTLMDEGTYTCVFTLFPSGIHETAIPLIVPGMIHSNATHVVFVCVSHEHLKSVCVNFVVDCRSLSASGHKPEGCSSCFG